MIKEITMRNIKGQTESQKLTGKDIIIGPNGVGKTTRMQALGISLIGYVPGRGKLPAETFKLANADQMSVGLVTDQISFARSFTRSEKSEKDGSKSITVSQEITISPSRGEKKAVDKEARIAAEVGNFPVMLDFNEFLSLSDAKRRDFIYSLSAIESDTWNRARVEKYLREKLLTMDLEVNNPDQYRIMEKLIVDVMKQFPEGYEVQAGLQSMLDWAKAKQTHWNAEKKDAEGAVKKLAHMKNQLAETDRNIAQHKAELEQLQQLLTETEAQFARDQERKRSIDQRLARITELNILSSDLVKNAALLGKVNYDWEISDLQSQIKQHDFSADFIQMDQEMQTVKTRLQEAREKERTAQGNLSQTRAEKQLLTTTLKRIEEMLKQRQDGNPLGSICIIHPKIGCDKDFSKAESFFRQQLVLLEQKEADQEAVLKQAQQEIENLEGNRNQIDNKRSNVLKDQAALNDANEAKRRAIANLEKKKGDEENARARINDQLRMYREELERLQNLPAEPIAPLDILEMQRTGLKEQIKTLKAKLEEQEKAKITLSNLKSSMIDSKTSAYHAQCIKDLVEALGAKGLQGELVKGILEPIRADIQSNLSLMDIDREFYFATESDTGKEVFQFGWRDRFGEERNFDALSTGQQLLLLIAILVTFLERANPPLKVLAIDNIENLDRTNFRRMLTGMDKLSGKLDNIILSGVVDLYEHHWIAGKEEKTLLPELKEWGVTDLGIEAIGEVKQSA